jgi:hypothetical protein
MAADVSDMTEVFLSCAFCMSILRLPVLGSMSPVVLSVSRYCRSSDGLSGKVGLGVEVGVEVEVKVFMEESCW